MHIMCQNTNSWISASAQLASTVFKAYFARNEAKNWHDQLEKSTDASMRFSTMYMTS